MARLRHPAPTLAVACRRVDLSLVLLDSVRDPRPALPGPGAAARLPRISDVRFVSTLRDTPTLLPLKLQQGLPGGDAEVRLCRVVLAHTIADREAAGRIANPRTVAVALLRA